MLLPAGLWFTGGEGVGFSQGLATGFGGVDWFFQVAWGSSWLTLSFCFLIISPIISFGLGLLAAPGLGDILGLLPGIGGWPADWFIAFPDNSAILSFTLMLEVSTFVLLLASVTSTGAGAGRGDGLYGAGLNLGWAGSCTGSGSGFEGSGLTGSGLAGSGLVGSGLADWFCSWDRILSCWMVVSLYDGMYFFGFADVGAGGADCCWLAGNVTNGYLVRLVLLGMVSG